MARQRLEGLPVESGIGRVYVDPVDTPKIIRKDSVDTWTVTDDDNYLASVLADIEDNTPTEAWYPAGRVMRKLRFFLNTSNAAATAKVHMVCWDWPNMTGYLGFTASLTADLSDANPVITGEDSAWLECTPVISDNILVATVRLSTLHSQLLVDPMGVYLGFPYFTNFVNVTGSEAMVIQS